MPILRNYPIYFANENDTLNIQSIQKNKLNNSKEWLFEKISKNCQFFG